LFVAVKRYYDEELYHEHTDGLQKSFAKLICQVDFTGPYDEIQKKLSQLHNPKHGVIQREIVRQGLKRAEMRRWVSKLLPGYKAKFLEEVQGPLNDPVCNNVKEMFNQPYCTKEQRIFITRESAKQQVSIFLEAHREIINAEEFFKKIAKKTNHIFTPERNLINARMTERQEKKFETMLETQRNLSEAGAKRQLKHLGIHLTELTPAMQSALKAQVKTELFRQDPDIQTIEALRQVMKQKFHVDIDLNDMQLLHELTNQKIANLLKNPAQMNPHRDAFLKTKCIVRSPADMKIDLSIYDPVLPDAVRLAVNEFRGWDAKEHDQVMVKYVNNAIGNLQWEAWRTLSACLYANIEDHIERSSNNLEDTFDFQRYDVSMRRFDDEKRKKDHPDSCLTAPHWYRGSLLYKATQQLLDCSTFKAKIVSAQYVSVKDICGHPDEVRRNPFGAFMKFMVEDSNRRKANRSQTSK